MANPSQIISAYLQSEIERGSIPGAQYAIGEDREIVAEDALGFAVIEPERVTTTLDTIYDVASLTKPLVTALLIMKFYERGLLDLLASIADYLIELGDTGLRRTNLLSLLTQTSGLPSWLPLYLEAQSRVQVPAAIARVPVVRKETNALEVIYSDLNYILLGFVLERLSGERLDRLAGREIFDPLDLKNTTFNPRPDLIPRIAATEHGREYEYLNAAATPFISPSMHYRWRHDVIRGEVHDGNANFMGGVAGHAGLFSTAREVFTIANQFIAGSELLKPESLHWFRDNLTPGCETSRSIAWILAETPDCAAGSALPPYAFGHNGFTGASVWIDPEKRRTLILLTNRIHPRVDPIDMRGIRRRFNTLAIETLNCNVENA
jgi:serine-type D-Ala-D-Ala carboxypeptidase